MSGPLVLNQRRAGHVFQHVIDDTSGNCFRRATGFRDFYPDWLPAKVRGPRKSRPVLHSSGFSAASPGCAQKCRSPGKRQHVVIEWRSRSAAIDRYEAQAGKKEIFSWPVHFTTKLISFSGTAITLTTFTPPKQTLNFFVRAGSGFERRFVQANRQADSRP